MMIKNMLKRTIIALSLLMAGSQIVFALDINTATPAELDALKGIGPVKAKAIIEERNKGPFKNGHDLAVRVRGIGDKSVLNLQKSGVTINGSSSSVMSKDTKPTKSTAVETKAMPQGAVIGDSTINSNSNNKNVKSVLNSDASKPVAIKTEKEAKAEKVEKLEAKLKASKEAKDAKANSLNANIAKQEKNSANSTNAAPNASSSSSVMPNKDNVAKVVDKAASKMNPAIIKNTTDAAKNVGAAKQ
jgi:competence protein ComEA